MLESLVDQMHWSNAATCAWLAGAGAGSACHGEILRLAAHVLNVEAVWIRRAGGEQGDRDTFRLHDPADMPALNDANRSAFRALLSGDPGRMAEYRMFDGSPGRTRVADIILHAVTHGFHHRGQMSALAARAGAAFPGTAYITWARLDPRP